MLKKLMAKIIKKELCPRCNSLKTYAQYGDNEYCEWEYDGHVCYNCLYRWDCMMSLHDKADLYDDNK